MINKSQVHVTITGTTFVVAILAVIAAAVGAFWGLNVRWLATAALCGFGLVVLGAMVDSALDRRDLRRLERAFTAAAGTPHPLLSEQQARDVARRVAGVFDGPTQVP